MLQEVNFLLSWMNKSISVLFFYASCTLQSPDDDLARWCLPPPSLRCCLRWGPGGWEDAAGGRGPSLLSVNRRVCSANSVWIRVRSRPETLRPFSTKISSPGRRPVGTPPRVRGSGVGMGGVGVGGFT